jgi:hypothetical protein
MHLGRTVAGKGAIVMRDCPSTQPAVIASSAAYRGVSSAMRSLAHLCDRQTRVEVEGVDGDHHADAAHRREGDLGEDALQSAGLAAE